MEGVAPVHVEQEHTHEKRAEASIAPNPGAMRLSAFAGIAVVLVIGALYLGINSLRGSLPDTTGTGATVPITEDGQFTPPNISVTAGGTLTIENKNKDPQVIKAKESGSELFPVQVLFDKPYSFVIPVDVAGVFTYVSETLPNSQQLTITVTPAMEAAATTIPNTAPAPDSLPIPDPQAIIPLPFGEPMQEKPQILTEVPVLETSVSAQPVEPPTPTDTGERRAAIACSLRSKATRTRSGARSLLAAATSPWRCNCWSPRALKPSFRDRRTTAFALPLQHNLAPPSS